MGKKIISMISYVLVLLRWSDMPIAFKLTLRLSSDNESNGPNCGHNSFCPPGVI